MIHDNKDLAGTTTKTCTKCGGTFPRDGFYRDQKAPDGFRPDCKECNKKRARAWQDANREHVLAHKKVYYQRPGKHELNYANQMKSRARHPEKYAARQKVNTAIKLGKLVRQPCKDCGAPRANAHHHDYSKPYDVEWLCTRCHGAEHRRENAAKRAAQ